MLLLEGVFDLANQNGLPSEAGSQFEGLHFVHSDLGLSDGEPAHAGEPPLSGVVGCCAPTAL